MRYANWVVTHGLLHSVELEFAGDAFIAALGMTTRRLRPILTG